jgi:hypothetical protein
MVSSETHMRDGGEGLRLQSQGGLDLCADAAAEHHIFKSLMNMRTGNKVGAFFPIRPRPPRLFPVSSFFSPVCDVTELHVSEWIADEKKMFSLSLCVLMCLLTIRNNLCASGMLG